MRATTTSCESPATGAITTAASDVAYGHRLQKRRRVRADLKRKRLGLDRGPRRARDRRRVRENPAHVRDRAQDRNLVLARDRVLGPRKSRAPDQDRVRDRVLQGLDQARLDQNRDLVRARVHRVQDRAHLQEKVAILIKTVFIVHLYQIFTFFHYPDTCTLFLKVFQAETVVSIYSRNYLNCFQPFSVSVTAKVSLENNFENWLKY